ncbi:hypothetical protein Zmor_026765 [Zophobas morio]|uniref:Uncharacterized protein n=1 Tax=Zophobas morio TaxID=2755281 RepID=A0AA38M684_9CUCU|nr:hypothetical protein Zmor_026765 [Zophobas morio]
MADMEELKTTMKVMMQGINELKEGQQKYEEEMRILRSENADVKVKLNEQGSRVEMLEKEKIRNNLVITGFEVNTDDCDLIKKHTGNFIKEKLGVESKIKTVRKLGPKKGILEIETFENKIDI